MKGKLLFILAIGVLLTACGTTEHAATNIQAPVMDVSRVKSYHSIHELNADSSIVVLAAATGNQSVAKIGTVPFTVTTMQVTQVLRGRIAGSSISLRQTGGRGVTLPDEAGIVQPGTSYLLFLTPFILTPGVDSGQYVVVGVSAGQYRIQGANAVREDPASTDLPASIAVSSAASVANS